MKNKALNHAKLLEKLIILIDKAAKPKDLIKLEEAQLKLKNLISKNEEAEKIRIKKE